MGSILAFVKSIILDFSSNVGSMDLSKIAGRPAHESVLEIPHPIGHSFDICLWYLATVDGVVSLLLFVALIIIFETNQLL